MADKLVQLKDKAGNHIFPIAKGLAELSVGTSNIKNQAVTTDKIANGSITSAKIADGILDSKVDVASINLTGKTTTLLSLTKALGANGTSYARWTSTTDGGSSGISDKPTGSTIASFVCEAECSRWASSTDYTYQLTCWVQSDLNPYVAVVTYGSTYISWGRLVAAGRIANTSIGGEKLADKAVTAAKIADKTVTAAKIADKTVTAAKIADSTITSDKINWSSLINKIYPVGSIYVSVNNTNPSTFIGGTWSQFGAGRTLVGVNTGDTDFKTVQKTGGAKTHRHDTAIGADSQAIFMRDINTQSHTGTYSGQIRSYYRQWEDHDTAGRYWYTYNSSSLQPYITVYFWRRTA